MLQNTHAHDCHPVAHGHGFDLIVRHVDGGGSKLFLQIGDLGAHLHPQFGVQVGEWFVHEKHLGFANDCTSHGHALTLSAGEFLRATVKVRHQIEQLRRPFHLLCDLLFRLLAQTQPEGDVVGHRKVRVQGIVLEHHRNVAVLRCEIVHHFFTD